MNTRCRPLRGQGLRWLLPFVLALGPAAAHAAAGQVLFALGRVEIQRGSQTFAAQRGAPVEVGDTLSTGPTGLAQVRLRDGAMLSLRYGSTLKVEDFQLPSAAPAAAAPAVKVPAAPSAGGRSVLRLVRGAFRTVTGLIGRNSSDAYSVITPVATIGIRGTDYSAAYCSGDCGKTPDGLYVGVSNGAIALKNAGGELVLENDQYGYVKDASTPPDRELAPPEVLENTIPPEEEGGDDEERDGVATAGDEAPPDGSFRDDGAAGVALEEGRDQPEGDYEIRPGDAGVYAYSAPGHRGSHDSGLFTDATGALVGFLDGVQTRIGTAQNVELGFDAATGLRWGRWSGGVATVDGSDLALTSQSLHWVYGLTADRAALPISGQFSYTLVGNTNPTDAAGGVGFLGDATLFADFTNRTVGSTLTIGFGDVASGTDTLWQATGSGSIAPGTSLFDGSYTFDPATCANCSVTYTDTSGLQSPGTGAFSGFFTRGGDAAGLAFELDNGSVVVSGAAAFEGSPSVPAAAGAP